jgi:TldD protein
MKSGISARVYKNGVWGFASHPELTREAAEATIKAATENELFLDSREKRGMPLLPEASGKAENTFMTKQKRLKQTELVGFAREVDVYIEKKLGNLISRTVVLNTLDMEKSLITSAGTAAYSMIPRTILYVLLSADKTGAPVELYNVFGGLG